MMSISFVTKANLGDLSQTSNSGNYKNSKNKQHFKTMKTGVNNQVKGVFVN